jgi:hypothetical protein
MDLGGTWYVLTFPTENETWCFNSVTGRWHRWSSYPYAGVDGRHRANCYCYHAGKHLIGDFEVSSIYRVDVDTYSDYGNTIRAQVVLPPIEKAGRYLYHNRLELEIKNGVGLSVGQGSDPQIMLDWSDTDQRTWSNEHWRSMGKIGEYRKAVTWNGLGRAKKRNYRVTIADPVEREISGFDLSFTVGGY